MKKYIYIAALAFTTLFSACDDFLSVESPDQLTSDKFWRDEADALSGLSAAYSQLEYSISSWQMSEVKFPVESFREDILKVGHDVYNWAYMLEYYNFTFNQGSSQISLYWSNNYKGANYANQVITKVPEVPEGKITEDMRQQILNEAYFLRAYYHLKLILNWKEIIISDKYVDASNLNKPLSSREAAWDFIIEDLKRATKLPSSHPSENAGRATCGAAYAYLGFAYLTRAYEETAKKDEYLREALAAFSEVKGYELEKKFISMFDGSNKNCKESVFELQFTMNSDGGAYYKHQVHKFIATYELSGWEEMYPSDQLINEFKKEGEIATTGLYDTRMYQTMFFQCDYFNDGTGKVYGYDYDDVFSGDDGIAYNKPAFRKYLPPTINELLENYTAINLPLMRYANVLLMKAEVLNLQGHPEQAIPIINEVRKVHGDMPEMKGTSQENVQAQIEHERMIEFPLEAWRFYDLRRWGKLDVALHAAGRTTFSAEKHSFYPIPQSEIKANSALSGLTTEESN